jgi:hypothetical protein
MGVTEVTMTLDKWNLDTWLTADNVVLALLILGTVVFSILAAQAEQRLWRKTRHIRCRLKKQRFITGGKAHLR